MRLLALSLALAGTIGIACSQVISEETTRPLQIRIRHADPWFVKAMLEGQQMFSPEISTIMLMMGAPQGAAQSAQQGLNAFFTGGKLIVNPGDNSIWFIPDRIR